MQGTNPAAGPNHPLLCAAPWTHLRVCRAKPLDRRAEAGVSLHPGLRQPRTDGDGEPSSSCLRWGQEMAGGQEGTAGGEGGVPLLVVLLPVCVCLCEHTTLRALNVAGGRRVISHLIPTCPTQGSPGPQSGTSHKPHRILEPFKNTTGKKKKITKFVMCFRNTLKGTGDSRDHVSQLGRSNQNYRWGILKNGHVFLTVPQSRSLRCRVNRARIP